MSTTFVELQVLRFIDKHPQCRVTTFIIMYTWIFAEWEERNLVCLAQNYSTGRLPEASYPLDGENSATSSATRMSTRSQDKKCLTLDREKVRLLKNIKSLSALKGVEAIILAQKLGYREPVIKAHEAKNYIKQLKSQYNVKQLSICKTDGKKFVMLWHIQMIFMYWQKTLVQVFVFLRYMKFNKLSRTM